MLRFERDMKSYLNIQMHSKTFLTQTVHTGKYGEQHNENAHKMEPGSKHAQPTRGDGSAG